jgi:L-fucose isomerase-like protein
MPDAEDIFTKSCLMLDELHPNTSHPDVLLTSPEMLSNYLDGFERVDMLIYQCTTFVGGDFVPELTRRFNCPVIIWSVREPSIDGGRLKLNSLTGAFSAANNLYSQKRKFGFVFGNPDSEDVKTKFRHIFASLEMIEKLRNMVIGVIGSQPSGFGFGGIDEALLNGKLGVRIIRTEVSSIIAQARSYQPDTYAKTLDEIKSLQANSLPPAYQCCITDENFDKHARLMTAYQDFAVRNGVSVIASRCWPDFFVEYGAPVCAALSFLNDIGIPASCETDIGGAVSMYIGSQLTGKPAYFGDPVAIDDNCGAIVFWHCGAGAPSLAKDGAKLGVHPNRKIGPVMEFGLKSGVVTILRLSKTNIGFRMLVCKGVALDEPQKFYGTSLAVRPLTGSPAEKIQRLVADGAEPHFVIAYGEITEELKFMCQLLDIEYYEY